MNNNLLCFLIVTIGCGLTSFGEIMIKYSERAEKKVPVFQRRKLLHRPLFYIGNVISIVSTTSSSAIASNYGNTTLVMPLGASHLIFTMIFSHLILKEHISRKSVLGILWIFFGLIFTFFGADEKEVVKSNSTLALLQSYATIRTLIFVIPYFILLFMCMYITITKKTYLRYYETAVAATPALCGVSSNLALRLLSPLILHFNFRDLGGYILLTYCIVSALTQLLFVNIGIATLKPSVMIPIMSSTLIVISSIGGMLVFTEKPKNIIFFSIGISIIVSGVLAFGRQAHSENENEIKTDYGGINGSNTFDNFEDNTLNNSDTADLEFKERKSNEGLIQHNNINEEYTTI